MPFPTDTILMRREPKDDPFDRLKVVGVSPIRTARAGEWAGETGNDVIVEALTEFASPGTFPDSVLEREYDVESMPELVTTQVIDPRSRPRVSQLTPEESLRRQAAEIAKGQEKKSTRQKTAIGETAEA
jgi:hypothetical protein